MPFMKGRAPIRRTIQYLTSGKLVLRDKIRVFSINYNSFGEHHDGARNFVFWNLPQLQYKNPDVQVVTLKNMTPSPFIKCYYEDGKQLLIDVDSKTNDEIEKHLITVAGKSKETLEAEARSKEKKDNPANMGVGCQRPCICEVPDQVPCPGVVPLPYHMRGKYIHQRS